MKILFVLDSPLSWQSGIWLHRNQIPSEALNTRGHAVKQMAIGNIVPQTMMDWPDTVIFGRAYATQYDPAKIMRDYKKLGKRVLYDLDDDMWVVDKDNPSHLVSNALKDQYEAMIKEADAVISPSRTLLKKLQKHFKKPTFFCPNGFNDLYFERPHETDRLKIGYMGASSHWKDLQLVGEVIAKLAEKYDFLFVVYGIVGSPMEAEIYSYNKKNYARIKTI